MINLAKSRKAVRNLTLVTFVAGLAACGSANNSDSESAQTNSISGLARQLVTQTIEQRKARNEPAPAPKSSAEMIAEALRVNPNPMIFVQLEDTGRRQILAMTGQNGNMRTYMSPDERGIILRNGILVGTRGFGHDVSAVTADTNALVLNQRSGEGGRTMRYYAADGLERPLPLRCSVGASPVADGAMVENCSGNGVEVTNSYVVQGGVATASRQWIGPDLGYAQIQVIRR